MSETKNGNLRPDGFSVSLVASIPRFGVLGLSGTPTQSASQQQVTGGLIDLLLDHLQNN